MLLERNCFNEPIDCYISIVTEVCDSGIEDMAVVNLPELLSGCDMTTINVSFHTTEADAENGSNSISNPESYELTTSEQLLWGRAVVVNDPDTFTVFFINLTVVDCCDNPQLYLEDLVLYMPLAQYPIELISDYSIPSAVNESVTDRDNTQDCALNFNEQEDFTIPVTSTNSIVQGEPFSISLWFKMQNEDPGNLEIMLQKGSSTSDGFQIGVFDLNSPLFYTNNFSIWDNDWNTEVDVDWTNTDWHHLVLTVDNTNSVRLYRDGILRNESINSNLDIGSTSLSEYRIGQGLQGHLDDLRVYKRTLNPTEIQQLFALGGDCYTCL